MFYTEKVVRESLHPVLTGGDDIARMVEANLPHTDSHSALRRHLSDAVNQAHGVDGMSMDSPYVMDVFPNHVVYQHQGQMMKRRYSMTQGAAGTKPKVTLGEAKNVHVAYVDTKESETYSILTDIPADVEERDIPASTRKKADASDFAGKHRSFPILKPEDVMAALRSIGRAGADNYDAATLKANILRIAKRKGFAVPQSDKQADVIITDDPDALQVFENAAFCGEIKVKEGTKASVIPVKIIGPGWGSSAYYSTEVLKRAVMDGVWHKGQHMMMNHQTATEEAERPEGDINNLAAVLMENASWMDSGPKGPGVYSKAKVFSDFASQVSEKGPYIGVSINAAIKAHEGEAEGKTGKIADKFVKAFSTDFVTKPGAGGAPIVPVTEGARTTTQQEEGMTAEETREMESLRAQLAESKAKEAAALEAQRKLEAQQNQVVAVGTISKILREAEIPFSSALLTRACQNPVVKEGKIDRDWLDSIVADFTEGQQGRVTGAGHVRETDKDGDEDSKTLKEAYKILGVPEAGLEIAVKAGGR